MGGVVQCRTLEVVLWSWDDRLASCESCDCREWEMKENAVIELDLFRQTTFTCSVDRVGKGRHEKAYRQT